MQHDAQADAMASCAWANCCCVDSSCACNALFLPCNSCRRSDMTECRASSSAFCHSCASLWLSAVRYHTRAEASVGCGFTANTCFSPWCSAGIGKERAALEASGSARRHNETRLRRYSTKHSSWMAMTPAGAPS